MDRHGDRRQRAGGLAHGLERAFERDGVHDGGEHADRVAAHALDAASRSREAAEEIAAADDDSDFDAEPGRRLDVEGDALQRRRVEPVLALSHEGLARQLHDDTGEAGRRHGDLTKGADESRAS